METAQLLWQQVAGFSTLPTALLATGILVLLVPKLRRIVHDVLETIIASFLLLVLILVVLGLPFGEHSSHVHCTWLSTAWWQPAWQASLLLLWHTFHLSHVLVPINMPSQCCGAARMLLCPAAATYIAFKGVVFTLRSITGSLPYLHNLVTVAIQHVTQHA